MAGLARLLGVAREAPATNSAWPSIVAAMRCTGPMNAPMAAADHAAPQPATVDVLAHDSCLLPSDRTPGISHEGRAPGKRVRGSPAGRVSVTITARRGDASVRDQRASLARGVAGPLRGPHGLPPSVPTASLRLPPSGWASSPGESVAFGGAAVGGGEGLAAARGAGGGPPRPAAGRRAGRWCSPGGWSRWAEN